MKSKETTAIGLMLFALFFGAGNMIFPPALGQAAGTNIWSAIFGFLITGVGLPLLGVTAIAYSGGDLQSLSNRVHPIFGIVFTTIVYLAIGPFFGIPRTGTVAYSIGVTPFLSENINSNGLPLFIFSIFFFGLTYWLALNPSKLVDRIGKVLTPILFAVIAILVIKSLITPMGSFGEPQVTYQTAPFFKGFIEGYLTMDAIAALVFGIVVISAVKERGITEKRELIITTIKAAGIAAVGLAFVYVSLGYIGASSASLFSNAENGGIILSGVAQHLFGPIGSVLLGIAIMLATLTTSVGLVSATGEYLSKITNKLSYRTLVSILSFFSMLVANVGLTTLIQISVPVLVGIYPLAIMLMVLPFFDKLFQGSSFVYTGAMIGTSAISIFDGLSQASIDVTPITSILAIIPFYSEGVGWILPGVIGALIGYLIAKVKEGSIKEVTN